MASTADCNRPIGVFDSGMGGLTVLKALKQTLPNEAFIYLGDTARLPYGTKSIETVLSYAKQMTELLLARDIKLLVIACNTASTAALTYLQQQFPELPIIGVIEPAAKIAAEVSQQQTLVLATETTIQSHIYQQTIAKHKPKLKVSGQAAGLLVALAEEGHCQDEIAQVVLQHYLNPWQAKQLDQIGFDCLLLGCTHFPVFIPALQALLGANVSIINSAEAVAKTVHESLLALNLMSKAGEPRQQYLVTDLPERFVRISHYFLGETIMQNSLSLIDSK